MPPQVAEIARASGFGTPGPPSIPLTASYFVAAISELIPKHLSQGIISQLGLLKANNIRPPLIEPGQKARHALLERVDVPGDDAHWVPRYPYAGYWLRWR